MEKQEITWIKNDGKNKPALHKRYLIKTNWRVFVGYFGSNEYQFKYWRSTEGNTYQDTTVSEFAEI